MEAIMMGSTNLKTLMSTDFQDISRSGALESTDFSEFCNDGAVENRDISDFGDGAGDDSMTSSSVFLPRQQRILLGIANRSKKNKENSESSSVAHICCFFLFFLNQRKSVVIQQ